MAGKPGHRGWGHIRKLPSKRFQASYVGDDLVRHKAPRTFTSKMDAEAWLHTERIKLERGEWQPPAKRNDQGGLTLAEYADTWTTHRKLRPRTESGYRALLRLHIEPTLGTIAVATLTPDAVRRWYSKLGTDHPTRNAHCYQLLHAIMSTAVEDGLIPANPVHIRGAMHAKRKKEPVILAATRDRDEVALLASAMPPELSASVLLAAWCGLRYGETTELRRKDIDTDTGVLTVARGVTYRDGEFIVQPTKSGEIRHVTIPPHIRPAVAAHLAQHTGKSGESLLFPAADGGHLLDQSYRKSFTRAAKKIGRPGLTPHALRHFSGTIAARVGGTTAETMARLGHSTVDAAMRYQNAALERDAVIAAAMSALVVEDKTLNQ
ncbi:tyrosine-type recombinase/integrase [Gordonia zhaorongruii]|uniref:tyrosine-type recombinase/integrase n=1 Tax=Gordonia zhaorongruii TaxID=2597659 RepID=UPI00118097AB|nr:site-specific integrase [Gordonia zhaorongruii]